MNINMYYIYQSADRALKKIIGYKYSKSHHDLAVFTGSLILNKDIDSQGPDLEVWG